MLCFSRRALFFLLLTSGCKPAASAGVTLASEPLVDITEEGDIFVDVAMSGYKAQSEFEQKPTGFHVKVMRDGAEVAEAPLKAIDGGYAMASFVKPELLPGHYAVEVGSGGAPMSVTAFDVANVPCIGGFQKKVMLTYGPRVQASDTDKGFTLRPGRWLLHTGQKAWAVRWLREEGSALVTTTTGVSEAPEGILALEDLNARSETPIACPVNYDSEVYEVPNAVLAREGKYVARIVREEGEPIEIHFAVNGSNEPGGATPTKVRSKAGFSRRTTWATLEAKPFTPDGAFTASLASVPKKRAKEREKKSDVENPLKVSGDEVRALLRKPELLDKRIAFNQLVSGAPAKGSKEAELKAHRAEVALSQKELVRTFHEVGAAPWAASEMKDAFSAQPPPPPPPPPAPSVSAPPAASASAAPSASAKKVKPAPKKKP